MYQFFVFIASCNSPLDLDRDGNQVAKKSSQKNATFSEVIRALDEKDYNEALSLSNDLPDSGYKYNFHWNLSSCFRKFSTGS